MRTLRSSQHRRRRQWTAAAATLLVVATGVAATGVAHARDVRAVDTTSARSIVQLGDSVAAGEGTLYGYRYDRARGRWTGGDLDATWPGPYPLCHTSPDAFGVKVAAAVGARFTQLACTGAQFRNGIATREVEGGHELRPAQFGDWTAQTDLNAEYDAADPDLVLVTLGADDVHFVKIVTACIENGLEHRIRLVALECTRANPGPAVQADFVANLPDLRDQYEELVAWIAARAAARGVTAPKVLFTTYPDPLPKDGAQCPDSSWLRPSQLRYLSGLVARLNRAIRTTVAGLRDPSVAVVDSDRAYRRGGADHRWCSKDPWAYGLSILHLFEPDTLHSQAPFHPTPEGQASIATLVEPVVQRLLAS